LRNKLLVLCSVFFLSGCSNQLINQAVRDAKTALEEQNYERAKSLLIIAHEEGGEVEADKLQSQIGYLISMKNYLDTRQLDSALLKWTELNLSPSESRIVKDEAKRMLQSELSETANLVRSQPRRNDLHHATTLLKRLSTFEMFQAEISELQGAKDRVE